MCTSDLSRSLPGSYTSSSSAKIREKTICLQILSESTDPELTLTGEQAYSFCKEKVDSGIGTELVFSVKVTPKGDKAVVVITLKEYISHLLQSQQNSRTRIYR